MKAGSAACPARAAIPSRPQAHDTLPNNPPASSVHSPFLQPPSQCGSPAPQNDKALTNPSGPPPRDQPTANNPRLPQEKSANATTSNPPLNDGPAQPPFCL